MKGVDFSGCLRAKCERRCSAVAEHWPELVREFDKRRAAAAARAPSRRAGLQRSRLWHRCTPVPCLAQQNSTRARTAKRQHRDVEHMALRILRDCW